MPQPQGHVQLVLNMVDFGMSPQAAIDAPRFLIGPADTAVGQVSFEDGIAPDVVEELARRGHVMNPAGILCGYDRAAFGRAQVIARRQVQAKTSQGRAHVYEAGSDTRADGFALAY